MNKKLVFFFIGMFLFGILQSCTSISKLFNQSTIELNENKTLSINYSDSIALPLVKVEISGKTYTFLIDTGAPTLVSQEIYNALNLKEVKKINVKDSQGAIKKTIITSIPIMHIENVTFRNTTAFVFDFKKNKALSCRNIEGIIGANQMATAIWKFNYKQKTVTISNDTSSIVPSQFDFSVSFTHSFQKTPHLTMKLFNESSNMTFDTGSNGRIDIDYVPSYLDSISSSQLITYKGVKSIGIFGAGEDKEFYKFKPNKVQLGDEDINITSPIIGTSSSNLIGNKFLENYIFAIDWNKKKIYFKEITSPNSFIETFGFGYYFKGNVAFVSYVIQNRDFPLQIGDQILSINERDFTELTDEKACIYRTDRIERGLSRITIKVLRGNKKHTFQLQQLRLLASGNQHH